MYNQFNNRNDNISIIQNVSYVVEFGGRCREAKLGAWSTGLSCGQNTFYWQSGKRGQRACGPGTHISGRFLILKSTSTQGTDSQDTLMRACVAEKRKVYVCGTITYIVVFCMFPSLISLMVSVVCLLTIIVCLQDVEERMKKLLNSPPLVDDDSVDSMIKNIGWVQGDDELYQYIKVGP